MFLKEMPSENQFDLLCFILQAAKLQEQIYDLKHESLYLRLKCHSEQNNENNDAGMTCHLQSPEDTFAVSII